MKNSTILKDELGLLRADMSAVLKELNEVGDELKCKYIEVSEAKNELAEMRNTILEEAARLEDLRGRAVLVKGELIQYTQDLRNIKNTWETTRVKNSQEQKLHLGRIKELDNKYVKLQDAISHLKDTFDNNLNVYKQHESSKVDRLKALDLEILNKEKLSKEIESKFKKDQEEDKKLTKDRLKREDKIRAREDYLVAKEDSIHKKEEDLLNLSLDLTIVYGRLKELYAKVDPTVDLDRLVIQVK